MKLDIASASHVGRVRSRNEDAVLTSASGLAVVADGMGGHAAGDVASRLAVAAFSTFTTGELPSAADLLDAVDAGNRAIVDHAGTHPEAAGMGTTLTGMALVAADVPTWFCFNIGDSRAYRFADGDLEQLTVDHALGGSLLTRALGAPGATPDTWLLPAIAGESYLLCTDGVTGELRPAMIRAVLAGTPDARTAADELVAAAVRAGGRDNATAAVIRTRG